MANRTYPLWDKWINEAGSVNFTTADIRAVLVKSSFAFDATDEFLSDVGAGNEIQRLTAAMSGFASAVNAANRARLDADDWTFATVPGGDTVGAVVLYLYDASDSAARLWAWLDESADLPLATDGTDVTCVPPNDDARLVEYR